MKESLQKSKNSGDAYISFMTVPDMQNGIVDLGIDYDGEMSIESTNDFGMLKDQVIKQRNKITCPAVVSKKVVTGSGSTLTLTPQPPVLYNLSEENGKITYGAK